MNRVVAAILAVSLLSVASSSPATTELTSCGYLEIDDDVTIPADLDCTSQELWLSVLGKRTIAFNGSTLTHARIQCANCTVEGPGTLVGRIDAVTADVSNLDVVNGTLAARFLRVESCRVDGPNLYGYSGDCAIEGDQNFTASRLRVFDTVISGAHCGVRSEADTIIRDSLIEDSIAQGVWVYSSGYPAPLRMKNTRILRSGTNGLMAMRAIVSDSEIADSAEFGVQSYGGLEFFPTSASLKRTTVSGNQTGIEASDTLRVSDCVVTGNAEFGVLAPRPRLQNSTITGNATAPACGTIIPCADVGSDEEPRVGNRTICDTSYVTSSGLPGSNWGVCSLD